ncbi:AfsR/SARP family transcriptional regulator [Actinomadura sp. WAC 06369]|nr:AfsR/SARP family transcriptional regulator [Actinomadura sp. WAC 06369]
MIPGFTMGGSMEFKILGGLEVLHDGRDITPTAPKLRRVLCFLILHPNQIVQTEALIDELWGDSPVRSAMTTMQTYIYLLRKIINEELEPDAGERFLLTRPSGYMAAVPSDHIDLFRFEALTERGRAALHGGDPETAADLLSEAMGLWRGAALADVRTGRLLQAHVTRLEESRIRTLEMRIEADLRCGRHRELISELKALTAEHPYHEGFHRPLMLALYRSGRQWEALNAYRSLREVLVGDLGLEPSQELAELQQAVLTGDPSLDLPRDAGRGPLGPARQRPATAPAGPRPPAQLPPDIADFTGRARSLDAVLGMLSGPPAGTGAPAAALTGAVGTGKTALAVHAAHRVRDAFPDGQLYVDLRGSGTDPADPATVLYGFLRALGVAAEEIPPDRAGRAELYRRRLEGRRTLVLLDDMGDRPGTADLLPSDPGCALIATMRGVPPEPLRDREVAVGELSAESARVLLGRVVGRQRLADETEAADRIVRYCGRLPLAVRAAGARLAALPFLSLAAYAEQLAVERQRLAQLRSSDFDLRAQLEAAYRRLGEADRTALRWLSLLSGSAFTPRGCAALIGTDRAQASDVLERLTAARFLRETPMYEGSDPGAEHRVYRWTSELHRIMVCDQVVESLSESLRAS